MPWLAARVCNASIIQVSSGDSGAFVPSTVFNGCGVALTLLKSSRQRKSPMETPSSIRHDFRAPYVYARPWDTNCTRTDVVAPTRFTASSFVEIRWKALRHTSIQRQSPMETGIARRTSGSTLPCVGRTSDRHLLPTSIEHVGVWTPQCDQVRRQVSIGDPDRNPSLDGAVWPALTRCTANQATVDESLLETSSPCPPVFQ